MNKPLGAYKQLNESSRRLVNKLIISLTDEKLDDKAKMSINRSINRARREPDSTGNKYANGYTVFYREKFAQLNKKDRSKPVTEIAKQIGAEWRALDFEGRGTYMLKAAELQENK
jgi:hypothetical protein